MKKYPLMLAVFAFISIFLFIGCGGGSITMVNAKWEDGAYHVSVDKDVEEFDFTKEILVKNGYSYFISNYPNGNNILLAQKAKLSVGKNKFYVFVYNKNIFQNKYELIVFRKDSLVEKRYKVNDGIADDIIVSSLNKLQTGLENDGFGILDSGAEFKYNSETRVVSISIPSVISDEIFESIENSKRVTVRDDKNPKTVIVDFYDFECGYVTHNSEFGQYCVVAKLAPNVRDILQQYYENNLDAELYLCLDNDRHGNFLSGQANENAIVVLANDYLEAKNITNYINYYIPMTLIN